MMQNFNFIKKNESEVFREKCSTINQMVDKFLEKLQNLRKALFQCSQKKEKPLIDSYFQDDLKFIQKMIQKSQSIQQQLIFQQTIKTFSIYKCEYEQLCDLINLNLEEFSKKLRSFSTNHKIYEMIIQKKIQIQNYFYSLEDSDSPCKVRQEVFNF
ncbi:hypothetical protein ABPG74_011824 [Tetrahymena malaccensis]